MRSGPTIRAGWNRFLPGWPAAARACRQNDTGRVRVSDLPDLQHDPRPPRPQRRRCGAVVSAPLGAETRPGRS